MHDFQPRDLNSLSTNFLTGGEINNPLQGYHENSFLFSFMGLPKHRLSTSHVPGLFPGLGTWQWIKQANLCLMELSFESGVWGLTVKEIYQENP